MSKNILIIDDDIVSQFALRYTIQQANIDCEILVCDGAQEGLGILSNLHKAGKDLPDFIFLDLDMPDLDGWDFLDRYRNINGTAKRPKIFILSAFTSSLDRERAKEHSMVEGFFDKPLSRNSVSRILKSRPD
ncbi:response regulator [Pricia sp.]|uniref:response regulator n=1 Tax=Pricia sp. TaxID=2268138 RepID=UPI00359461CE